MRIDVSDAIKLKNFNLENIEIFVKKEDAIKYGADMGARDPNRNNSIIHPSSDFDITYKNLMYKNEELFQPVCIDLFSNGYYLPLNLLYVEATFKEME